MEYPVIIRNTKHWHRHYRVDKDGLVSWCYVANRITKWYPVESLEVAHTIRELAKAKILLHEVINAHSTLSPEIQESIATFLGLR